LIEMAVGEDSAVLQALEDFTRQVNEPESPVDRMQRAVEIIADLIPGCTDVGVTFRNRAGATTVAATSELVRRADQLQYELHEGPWFTVQTTQSAYSGDVAHDPRWPVWGPRVSDELGIGSVMSFLLSDEHRSFGSCKLYANRVDAFDHEDRAVAETFAVHLSVAVAIGLEIENRSKAMITRTVIGQAEGILMERLGITADQAFDELRRISSRSNQKLAAVAAELVRTRELPLLTEAAD
jgi:hypothetical protein